MRLFTIVCRLTPWLIGMCVASLSAILDAMPALELSLLPQNDARRNIVMSLPMQIEGALASLSSAAY